MSYFIYELNNFIHMKPSVQYLIHGNAQSMTAAITRIYVSSIPLFLLQLSVILLPPFLFHSASLCQEGQ